METKYFADRQVLYEKSTVTLQLCFSREDSESQSYKLVATSPTKQLSKIDGEWDLQISMRRGCLLKFQVDFFLKNPMISKSKIFSIDIAVKGFKGSLECRIDDSTISPNLNRFEFKDKSFNPSWGCRTISAELIIVCKRKVKKSLGSVNLDLYWLSIVSHKRLSEFTEFFDFTFIVQNEEFKVHKLCMATASEVMRTMFTTGLDETRTNSTVITDIDPKAFQIFIHYIYGNKYDFFTNFTDDLVFEVFKVAHKYDVKKLEHYCMARIFLKHTSTDHILDTYEFACVYDIDDNLKNYCWEVIQYDLLKLFMPMKPVAVQKVLDYIANMKKIEDQKNELSKKSFQLQMTFIEN